MIGLLQGPTICYRIGIKNYVVNDDMTISIDGSVSLYGQKMNKVPLRFKEVSGSFDCGNCELVSLEGCPNKVGRLFCCDHNQLESLKWGPEKVGSDFRCDHNKLKSLIGGPNEIGGNFTCSYNGLESLLGSPDRLVGSFNCSRNLLTSLGFCPNTILLASRNKITNFDGLPEFFESEISISYG